MIAGSVLVRAAAASAPTQALPRRVLPPQGLWEYAVVAVAVAVVALALAWLVVGFLRRGEEKPGHIKYIVLDEAEYAGKDGDCDDEA